MSVIARPKSGPVNRPMLLAALSSSAAYALWPQGAGDFVSMFASGTCLIIAVAVGTRGVRNLFKDYRLRRDLKKASKPSDTYGAARFSQWDEIEAAGLSDPANGNFVGLASIAGKKPIFLPVFARSPIALIEMPPGGGKTIHFVIGSIIHLAKLGRSLFISDVKAELAPMLVEALRRAGFEVWCINPAKAHPAICGSDEINLYQPVIDAVQAQDDFRLDAIKLTIDIAEIHLPEGKDGDNKNLFFRNGSRRCLIVLILSQAFLEPDRCTPADVFAILNDPYRFHERLLFLQYEIDKLHPYDGIAEFLRTEAASLLSRERDNPEHFGSFVEGATQTLLSFSQGGRLAGYGRGARIRMEELRERQIICFVIAPLGQTSAMMPVVSLLNMALLEAVKRKPTGRAVHIVGEEFLNYRFNDIVAGMETLRGLKVNADIFIQGFDGLERKFGQKAAASIEAYCDVRVYAALNSYDRAKRVSDMLANFTVRNANPSHGQQAKDIQYSHSETGRPLMTADEILAMPRNEALVFVRGMRPMKLRMAHYGEIGPWRDMVADNPLEGERLRAEPKFEIVYPEEHGAAPIRIKGVSYPTCPIEKGESDRVAWVRPKHLAWTLPFAAILLAFANLGSPHLRFAYSGAGGRFYSCDYVGPSIRRIVPPNGECPLIKFIPSGQ
ncbi:MAG: type IV secretory system conjugative DNA transfer family protein [Novosphingobium sp.]|nr:type IV secretory system conjugative DNA transfer family protein [Novosphingobium sp.]